jgi:hypothetical protein
MEHQTPAERGVEDWAVDWKLNPAKPGLLPNVSTREKEGREQEAESRSQKADGFSISICYLS